MVTDEELRQKAEKRASEKVDFLVHFTIYICVNALLIALWYFNGEWDGSLEEKEHFLGLYFRC
ncbi:MAG: 2TM domain-containing protein [Candidatus Thermoplasmatota archaeon]|nr:2TM domain-containing protein [Candidatus Thermoplasmatota archaeon]